MRALALAGLLLLGGCVAYTQPVPPPAPPPAPAPRPAYLSQRQAVDIAFQICRDRGLAVETVQRAHLDGAGRWHVELGGRDRARLLLDGRDGRLLKGKFNPHAASDEEWDEG
jgi:hypothetical protein